MIQLGLPPNRIDLVTSITGLGFDEAWAGRVSGDLHGIPVAFISKEAFIRNERQRAADLEALGAEVN